MFLSVAFALALSASPQDAAPTNEVAPAIVRPRRSWGGVVPTDLEIKRQLADALKVQPDKVICLEVLRTGSRLPRETCRTLQGWYDFEMARDSEAQIATVAEMLRPESGKDVVGSTIASPPHELVEMIKDRYQSPKARAQAALRARTRLAPPRSPVDPAVSNP
jgi:carbamoylphosphate synthase large subunit